MTITDDNEVLECLDARPDDACEGPVEMCSTDGIKFWPRCDKHFDKRMASYEASLERYADSHIAPDWFDPSDAGERWDDDY